MKGRLSAREGKKRETIRRKARGDEWKKCNALVSSKAKRGERYGKGEKRGKGKRRQREEAEGIERETEEREGEGGRRVCAERQEKGKVVSLPL